jgi:uncharacterized membrane protein
VTTNRLEAFSDGVLAIAITLLVIEIHPPEIHQSETLAHALWAQWPSYLAYMVSFLTIGVVWLNHHRIFTQVHRVDGPLLVLNLNLLLWTALIPFPTAVVAEYLQAGGELAQTAVALYGAVFLLVGLTFGGLFAWVTRDDRLLGQLLPREVVRSTRLRFMVGRPPTPSLWPWPSCRHRSPWFCTGPQPSITPSTRRRCRWKRRQTARDPLGSSWTGLGQACDESGR